LIVQRFPLLDNKPALIRAYWATCTGSNSVNAWRKADFDHSFVHKEQFVGLLRAVFYMNRLWHVFDEIDTDDDRKVSLEEFKLGADDIGLVIEDPEAEFAKIDTNGGGSIMFHEFVQYVARCKIPVD
jgi:Ca2+-binding EF-hand superfamily protein